MRIDTALRLVHGLVFFPGFEFTAKDHTNRFEGTIMVQVNYVAFNTDREAFHLSAGGYDEQIKTRASFPIMVGDLESDARLYRRLMYCLDLLFMHEAREALRVGETLWAPFHPHHQDGMRRWVETFDEEENMRLLSTDLTFGIG